MLDRPSAASIVTGRSPGDGLHLPDWASDSGGRGGSPPDDALRAGAALACLHPVATGRRDDVPVALLLDRLAMRAALGGLAMLGRSEGEAELRDEVYALRPGERPGPGGAVLERWRRVVGTPLRGRRIADVVGLPACGGQPGAGGRATPIAAALAAYRSARGVVPRDVLGAVAAADVALARALGWPRALPLLGMGLRGVDMARLDATAADGDGPDALGAAVLVRAAEEALRIAADVARACARLLAVAPRLRARTSDAALSVFLSQTYVIPARDLSPRVRGTAVAMSDRAARRLCERLVALGAARELTGRSWSRVYGL
jgi:hypothetical protein